MKIILSDLAMHLFPDRYPYFNSHFQEEKKLLKQDNLDDESRLNIAFKIKTTKLSLNIEKPGMRIFAQSFFDKLVEGYFDWNKEYDWKELKGVLLTFVWISDIKNVKELERFVRKPLTQKLYKKYLPNTLPVNKILS